MNVKISVFIICVRVIIYSLLYKLHDCNFNREINIKNENIYLNATFGEFLLCNLTKLF